MVCDYYVKVHSGGALYASRNNRFLFETVIKAENSAMLLDHNEMVYGLRS